MSREHDWRHRAACLDEDPELFHDQDWERQPAKGIREAEAKTICGWCPVRSDCLQFALDYRLREGVWGGLTADERHRLHRNYRRAPREHGAYVA